MHFLAPNLWHCSLPHLSVVVFAVFAVRPPSLCRTEQHSDKTDEGKRPQQVKKNFHKCTCPLLHTPLAGVSTDSIAYIYPRNPCRGGKPRRTARKHEAGAFCIFTTLADKPHRTVRATAHLPQSLAQYKVFTKHPRLRQGQKHIQNQGNPLY